VWCVVGSRRRLAILILSLCFSSWVCSSFRGSSCLVLLLVATWGNRKSGVSLFRNWIVSFTDFVWSLSSFAPGRHRRVVVFLLFHRIISSRVCGLRRQSDAGGVTGKSHHVVRQAISPMRSSLFCRCLTCVFVSLSMCPRRLARALPLELDLTPLPTHSPRRHRSLTVDYFLES
jgi:hypothetical protein